MSIGDSEIFLREYRMNPLGFVTEVLGATPDPWQSDVLESLYHTRLISIRSGHGVGKTTVASWCLLHHILTRFPQKSVCTAPTSGQLFDALFSELRTWVSRLPPVLSGMLECISDRVSLQAAPQESFISAKTSRMEAPESLQGVHSDHVLLCVDEASNIPAATYESAYSSMSATQATVLLLGNPLKSTGYFYDTFHRLSGDWKNFHVSCLDSTRVSPDFIREMRERYGSESNVFRTRCLGEFPIADDDTLISYDLVQSAINREIIPNPSTPETWGLDVARHGSDSSALCKRQGGRVVEEVKLWHGLDLMELCGAILEEWEKYEPSRKPESIAIDAIGMGYGVCDRLRECGLPVVGINVAESPSMSTRYTNKRAELWVRARDWFESRDCQLPDDRRLLGDLIAPRYTYASNGKLKLESKDDMRKRKIASPDAGDAFVLTLHNHTPYGAFRIPSATGGLRRELTGVS